MNRFSPRLVNCLIMCLIVVSYLGQAYFQVELPGLHYDEAVEVLPSIQLLAGEPITTFRMNGIHLNHFLLPLMTQDYIGALNTYLALPFLMLLGNTTAALRSLAIILGVITIWLTYLFASELYRSRKYGLLAAAILAYMPSFIFWSRQGIFVTSITAAIGLAAALSWVRWWRGRKISHAILGAFFFGMGLYSKLLFIWLIVALGLACAILDFQGWWQRLTAGNGRQRRDIVLMRLLLLGCSFLLGFAPLIIYNLQTNGTIISISQNFQLSYYGVNNLALIPNIITRFKEFTQVISGVQFWYLGKSIANGIAILVFAAGILMTFVASARSAKPIANRFLLPYIVILLVIIQSIFTVSDLFQTHFYMLLPWPAMATAGAAMLVQDVIKMRPAGQFAKSMALAGRFQKVNAEIAIMIGIFVLLLISEVNQTWQYHHALSISGGLSDHSDAVYKLANWLERRRPDTVIAMDWGMSAQVEFLTGGRVHPIEAFGYSWQTDDVFRQRIAPYIREEKVLFLWRTPEEVIFDRSRQFKDIYRSQNLQEDIIEAFYERSGRPLFGITKLVPRGRAENPPR